MARVISTRRYSFRSLHSLPALPYPEQLHGHQYFVEISLEGSGHLELDSFVEEQIVAVLDGQNLDLFLKPPTGENLVEWIERRLLSSALAAKIVGVALQETLKNRFVSSRTEPGLL